MTIAAGQVDRELSRNFQYLQGTWHSYYFQMPFAEETVAYNDFAFIEQWWRWAAPEWDIPAAALESIRATFRQPGVVQAALGYYRARYDASQSDAAVRADQARIDAGPVTVPTLAPARHPRPPPASGSLPERRHRPPTSPADWNGSSSPEPATSCTRKNRRR